MLAISPDATRIAYTANERLYLRALDQLVAQPVPGVEGAVIRPFFSPDSDWLAFYYDGQLVKVAVSGGAPVALCDIGNPTGASWEKDGTILFGQGGEGIYRVPDTGGTPELVVAGEQEPGRYFAGQLLPGGRAILFSLGAGEPRVLAQILDTGERVEIIEGTAGRFVAGGAPEDLSSRGHLLFARDGVLLAIDFDAASLAVRGGPVPILEDLRSAPGSGGYQFDLADNGTLLYTRGAVNFDANSLVLVDRGGVQEALAAEGRAHMQPRVSPDGRRVVVEVLESGNFESDLWVYDIDRQTSTRITFDEADDDNAAWAPDGQRVAFRSSRDPAGIYQKAADGTGSAELLDQGGNRRSPSSWSPDGRSLLFTETISSGVNIGVLSIGDDGPPRWLVESEFVNLYPSFSPDGRYVAYTSNESGDFQIYVVPFDEGVRGKWQISIDRGFGAQWSRDGRELFYEGGELNLRSLMAVTVDGEPTFRAGNPEMLFEWLQGEYLPVRGLHRDVTADARFVAVKTGRSTGEAAGPAAEELIVVQNWVEELRERVPLEP